MPVTRDKELETFKTAIDLRAFAASRGYVWDRKESWRGSAVMRHSNGDKIIIKLDTDRHYVFFSVRSDADSGSIIDFLQNRDKISLGAIRKTLRPWIGGKAPADLPLFPALPATTKDRMAVETAYRRMKDAGAHPYLTGERAIPPALLTSERFAGRIRTDDYGNAVFPHFDLEGLCGYEIKNKGYTGFSRGGSKGLWFSRAEDGDDRLVIAESAIDALSHGALFPATGARYASIGGKMSPRQPELLQATLRRLPEGSIVIAAMDADEEGRQYAEIVRLAIDATGRSDLRYIRHEPENAKDWNDSLRSPSPASRPSFPTVRLGSSF